MESCRLLVFGLYRLGTILSSGAIAWLPTLPASTGPMAMTAGVAQSLPAVGSFGLGVGGVSVPTVPAGGFMGEGLLPVAWAQYDRAFRRQMAQTKDPRWSKLNPTLFSVCFAGKAKCDAVCCHCLSDNQLAEGCPENPARMLVQWQMGVGWPSPVQASPRGTQKPKSGFMKICYLFNKKEGSGCAFSPCKFAHVCLGCRGDHPRSACPLGSGLAQPGSTAKSGMKRPRND